MDKAHLDPVAEILVAAYLNTASYSWQFNQDHEQPPTAAAKAHHMRSIAQALINGSDRFQLAPPYIEFGRVEFEDTTTGHCYLLRSDGAVKIERSKR